MADNQKYYYLKLKEDFFGDDALLLLESMPDGFLYSNILLKLYLKSLKYNGKLMFNEVIPYNAQMLATITRHQVGTVEKALQVFENLGLIDVLSSGAIYMNDIQLLIGTSSSEAERLKEYRKRIKEEKKMLQNKECTNERTNVHQTYPEIDIEKEIEIEKERDIKDSIISVPVKSQNDLLAEEFEKIWTMYPKKVGKTKALQKYKKFRTSKKEDYCTYGEVMAGLERYLKYIAENTWYSPKDGSTWFNNQSWRDEYELKEETESEFILHEKYSNTDDELHENLCNEFETAEFEELLNEFRNRRT